MRLGARALVTVGGVVLVEAMSIAHAGTPLVIYVDETEAPPLTRIVYGFDRRGVCSGDGTTPCNFNGDCAGNGVCTRTVDSLTPGTQTTIWDLVCDPDPAAPDPETAPCRASHWDFSGVTLATAAAETASTVTPINAAETCAWNQCGFNRPAAVLGREDKFFRFDDPADPDDLRITLTAQERQNGVMACEDGATPCTTNANCTGIGGGTCRPTSTIWLRAGVRNEGETQASGGGGLGSAESRICFVTDGGVTRTPVPLFRFANQDARGFYMRSGDAWGHPAFACEQNVRLTVPDSPNVCPDCGPFECFNSWIKACGTHAGKQTSKVVNEGTVTLPSGHTFRSLVVRQVTDFCAYAFSGCPFQPSDNVRQVIYLWQVPHLGTVVRLMSAQLVADPRSFTSLDEVDIKYGLFPPRSVAVTAVGNDSVTLAWDPGQVTHRIGRHKLYWDVDSGVASPYAFNSDSHPGQVVFSGNGATVSGLVAGTPYFFTVTAVSDYTDPGTCIHASCQTTTYESLLFPKQIGGTPAPVPAEVTATPTSACTPTAEVTGVRAGKVPGGIELCWDASGDPCVDGYQILGASSPQSAGGFSVLVDDTGPLTCWSFDPAATYLLVVGRGSGGTGPWGHYGQ